MCGQCVHQIRMAGPALQPTNAAVLCKVTEAAHQMLEIINAHESTLATSPMASASAGKPAAAAAGPPH